jgi:DNA-binding MarR family transcriptional regulator
MSKIIPMVADSLEPAWHRLESSLMLTSRTLRRAFDSAFADLNLNQTQATLLAYVDEFGPVTQTQIADALSMGRAAAGAIIDALDERQLVSREPDPSDRRVWQITLTASGKDHADKIHEIDEKVRTRLRDGISRPDRRKLAELLEQLKSNAGAYLSDPSSR